MNAIVKAELHSLFSFLLLMSIVNHNFCKGNNRHAVCLRRVLSRKSRLHYNIITMPVQEPQEEIFAWKYVKLDHFVV